MQTAFLIAAALLAVLATCFAGSTTVRLPWPQGLFEITLPIDIKNGINNAVVAEYLAKFDFIIRAAYVDYKAGAVDLDALSALTKDATKNIFTSYVPSAGDNAKTLHADVSGYQVKTGDKIQIKATSTTANAAGHVTLRLLVEPYYAQMLKQG